MPLTFKYAVSVVAGLLLYSAKVYASYYHGMHVRGADFIVEIGVPFTFWIEGGFGGLRLLLPGALVADLGVVIAISLIVGWTWGRIVANRPSSRGKQLL